MYDLDEFSKIPAPCAGCDSPIPDVTRAVRDKRGGWWHPGCVDARVEAAQKAYGACCCTMMQSLYNLAAAIDLLQATAEKYEDECSGEGFAELSEELRERADDFAQRATEQARLEFSTLRILN